MNYPYYVFDKAERWSDADGQQQPWAFVVAGLYLGWLSENELLDPDIAARENATDLRSRILTGPEVYARWGGVLHSDMLSMNGNMFSASYATDDGEYMGDFQKVFGVEFQGLTGTWSDYERIKPRIDARYDSWTRRTPATQHATSGDLASRIGDGGADVLNTFIRESQKQLSAGHQVQFHRWGTLRRLQAFGAAKWMINFQPSRDLIDLLASGSFLPSNEREEPIIAPLIELLRERGRVVVPGLGRFTLYSHPSKRGRNAQTGETVEIAPSVEISFRADAALLTAVTTS